MWPSMTKLIKSEVSSVLILALGTRTHIFFCIKRTQDALQLASWYWMWDLTSSPCPLLSASIVPSLHWSEHECRQEHEGGDWVCVAGRLETVVVSWNSMPKIGHLWESMSLWATCGNLGPCGQPPMNPGSQNMCLLWLRGGGGDQNQGHDCFLPACVHYKEADFFLCGQSFLLEVICLC